MGRPWSFPWAWSLVGPGGAWFGLELGRCKLADRSQWCTTKGYHKSFFSRYCFILCSYFAGFMLCLVAAQIVRFKTSMLV